MYQILIVGIGGFLGSVARYKLGGLVLHHTVDWRFPLATFVVNVVGCVVAGVLSNRDLRSHAVSLVSVQVALSPFSGSGERIRMPFTPALIGETRPQSRGSLANTFRTFLPLASFHIVNKL
jgi:hypothetical protein